LKLLLHLGVPITCAALLLIVGLQPLEGVRPPAAVAASGQVLAPVGRQVAWVGLAAPRRQVLTSFDDTASVLDVAATETSPYAVLAVAGPFGKQGPAGGDLVRMDTTSGGVSPLLTRSTAQESFGSPAWWFDTSGLLFESDDLSAPLPAYPGESTPRYASRIESINPDGSNRTTLIASGRMPAPSPDGDSVAVVQTTSDGTGLMLWSRPTGVMQPVIPAGQFPDIAYPRFSPAGDQIAFMVPEPVFDGRSGSLEAVCGFWRVGPCVASAHGLPWNLWLVARDGTKAHELAQVEGDDASVAWSPDGSQLLVYAGGGSYLVDAGSGTFQSVSYLVGYGAVAWLAQ
jgi:Tol biopolymer transport system component